jgi:GH43 family beta-xylosidase
MLELKDIRIRDPFILTDQAAGKYYLYGTTSTPTDVNFFGYESDDLVNWSDGSLLFRPGNGFWADKDFWAPEVYALNGRYFMFATFKSDQRRRAVQALVCDAPLGNYTPYSEPLTPNGWECLDSSLYIHEGSPYMFFCREWLDVGEGKVYTVKMTPDLKKTCGEPVLLFSALQSGWATGWKDERSGTCAVTDGPFVFKGQNGVLQMLWSSNYGAGNYAIGLAWADRPEGPWRHRPKPIFQQDGGHGMLFCGFDGRWRLCLHQPNREGRERVQLIDVDLTNGLKVKSTE